MQFNEWNFSPFFERIFAEHPCKHPVIVLKDFPGREVAALIDFMYRGEVRVGREELPGLMRAAESLQVRGLASSEPRPASPPETPTTDLLGEPSTPEGARQGTPPVEEDNLETTATRIDTRGGIVQREHRLPHMGHLNFSVRDLRELCGSPLMPRRKQARPRRRSGELVAQDLSRPHPPPSLSPPSGLNLSGASQQRQEQSQQQSSSASNATPGGNNNNNNIHSSNNNNHHHQSQQREDIAENLSLKRSHSPASPSDHQSRIKMERDPTSSPRCSPLTGTSLHPDGSLQDLPAGGLSAMSALSLTPPHHHSEYLTSLGQLAAQWLPNHPSQLQARQAAHHAREGSPQQHGRGQHNPYQQQQRESQQCRDQQEQHRQQQEQESSLPPIRSVAVFPMDGMSPVGGTGGLFPHGGGLDRGTLLADLHDSFKPETLHGLFGGASLGHHPGKKLKKHRSESGARRWADHGRGGMPIGRPKGQHSAPRGGPPRSWTNAELTIALQHVWNKQMTTSQASRMFGIPYNSLLMYVRGKYGKSLKLEQLKRDCTGATTGEVMNSLNNNVKAIQGPPPMSHPLAGLPHPGDEGNFPHHPLLGGNLPQGFFPDYSAAFPVPVSMVHLLPPSEQKALESATNPGGGSGAPGSCPPGSGSGVIGCPTGSPPGSDMAHGSRTPSPAENVHNHETSSSSMAPQTPQSAPALLQQNGSD